MAGRPTLGRWALSRWAWFILLWLGGVAAVGLIAFIIRSFLFGGAA